MHPILQMDRSDLVLALAMECHLECTPSEPFPPAGCFALGIDRSNREADYDSCVL